LAKVTGKKVLWKKTGEKGERILLKIPFSVFFSCRIKRDYFKIRKHRKGRYTFVTEMRCVFRDVGENFQMKFHNSGNYGLFQIFAQ